MTTIKRIDLKFIPHETHEFTTIGHWRVDGDAITIFISEEISWQNKFAVLFHELIEVGMCLSAGITTEECDAFDALFEAEYDVGIWPRSVEAGFDPRCPYRVGHKWGSRFERVVIWLLGANWKECNAECERLMENGH